MSKTRLYRNLVHGTGAMICTAIIGAGYFLGYAPHAFDNQEILWHQNQVGAMTAEVPRVERNKHQLSRECGQIEKQIAKLKNGISPFAGEHELLRSFSELAVESSTTLLDFQPAEGQPEGEFGVTILRVGFEGDYPSICRLLWSLENLDRVTRVSSFNLILLDRQQGRFELRMELDAFHHQQPPSSDRASGGAI